MFEPRKPGPRAMLLTSYAFSYSTALQNYIADISCKLLFGTCSLFFFSIEESFQVKLAYRGPSEILFVNYISIKLWKNSLNT